MRADARYVAVARSLALDEVMADVVAAMRAAGVEPVLLKGASLALWLYRDGPARGYSDIDLLVAPADHADAEAILTRLGFTPSEPEDYGGDFQQHARAWRRASDGVYVDLHRTLPGLRAISPDEAWQVLSGHRTTLDAGGAVVPVLDAPARLVLVCLHVVHHHVEGAHTGKSLSDLERAIEVATEQEWREALDVARRLEAVVWFAAGLRLHPRGDALADRIGAPQRTLLRGMDGADAAALVEGFERLAGARSLRARGRIVLRELAPSPELMRYSSPLARTGRVGLARAYAARVTRLLRQAGPSYRAWRRGSGR